MKKLLVLIGFMVASSQLYAQQNKTIDGGKQEDFKIVKEKKIRWTTGAKIAFLGASEDGGLLLENEAGEKMILHSNNEVTLGGSLRKGKGKQPFIVNLVFKGNTADGQPIWEDENGKSCTLDIVRCKTTEYNAKKN
jgi:hypothetical protein